ncbi:MAG: AAA family ATPase, partial [Saprospiraceae bacterium]|nr:AAA family ATPase [Saprospiraceae bacterium]
MKIQNFYNFKENGIELQGLKDKRIIFLLGENGTGKTIFLKALLIALKKKFIDKMPIEDAGVILDALRNNKKMKVNVSAYKAKSIYDLPNDSDNTKNN